VEEAVVTEAAEIHQAPPATALPERRRREGWLAWLIPVALLLLWEAAARAGWISQLLFPAPSEVLTTMGRLTASGELPRHVAISLQRVAAGLCVGAIPGITLGLAMGWSRRLRLLLDPLMGAIYPLPRIALFPLIMVLVGIGEASKVVTIGIGVFFPTLINSMTGVHGIPETYFEVARSYGARPWQVFRRVVLPGSLPTVFAGLRLAVGMALLLVIAIEFISARTGLGAFLWLAWETFRTTNVYVALLVSAFLGATLAWLVRRAEHRLLPWAEGLLHR
jgi:NitT/TauT family transport system permease protein